MYSINPVKLLPIINNVVDFYPFDLISKDVTFPQIYNYIKKVNLFYF